MRFDGYFPKRLGLSGKLEKHLFFSDFGRLDPRPNLEPGNQAEVP